MRQPATAAKALKGLMDAYQERLYWQIRRVVLIHEDANDVLQNTFLKVYKNMGQFEGKSGLYTWLYRIAHNSAIDFLNQQKRRTEMLQTNTSEFPYQQLHADPWFDGEEAEIRLHQAVAALPERQQQVFKLRYFDEMPYLQMSKLLGTSEGALKASYHHAVKKVEDQLMHSNNSAQ